MIELNLGAQKTLDQYLRQVHAYLRGSASVDVADVEQSIHEHVETELADASGPVLSCCAILRFRFKRSKLDKGHTPHSYSKH